MANIVYSLTRLQIRQAIGKMISSISPYTVYTAAVSSATAGSTTGTLVVPKLRAVPPTDTSLHVGSLLYVVAGTGYSSQPYYITAFSPGNLTVTPSWTSGTPDSTSTIEIYPSGKWSKDEIENAIDLAFWDGASRLLWPTEEVAIAFESDNPQSLVGPISSLVSNNFRTEYPIPSQFSWLTQLDYDQNNPILGYGPNNTDFTYLAPVLNDGFPLSWLQSFVPTSTALVSAASLYLSYPVPISALALSLTSCDAVQITIGTASGSVYTPLATSEVRLLADIPTRPAMIAFEFLSPVLLTANTTYWIELLPVNSTTLVFPSTLVSYTPADLGGMVHWMADSTGGYGKITGARAPTTAYSGSSFTSHYNNDSHSLIFYLYSDPQFRPMPHNAWSVVTGDDSESVHFDTAVIGQPQDGTLIRLRGARPANAFDQTVATDASVPEVEPTFLIYKAASLLAMARAPEPGTSVEAIQAKADLWGKQSEQHRQVFSIPPGAARKVR